MTLIHRSLPLYIIKRLALPRTMMNEWCFRPWFCTFKAILGQGQPGLMRWILLWTMPPVQDRSLDLLTSSLARYHCTTDAPWCKWIWNGYGYKIKQSAVFGVSGAEPWDLSHPGRAALCLLQLRHGGIDVDGGGVVAAPVPLSRLSAQDTESVPVWHHAQVGVYVGQ